MVFWDNILNAEIAKEIGQCNHRGEEARLDCFHAACGVVRVFSNGRILLQNGDGYVKAFILEEVRDLNS